MALLDNFSLDDIKNFLSKAGRNIGDLIPSPEAQQIPPTQEHIPMPAMSVSRAPDSFTPEENNNLVEQEVEQQDEVSPPVEDADDRQPVPTPTPGPIPSKQSILNFGKPSEDYKKSLIEAQNARDINQLIAGIGQASERIGAGIAGGTSGRAVNVQPGGQEFYKGLSQKADQPIENLQQRMQMDKQSPEAARGLKDFLESKFGLKIEGEPTTEQLKQMLPTLSHLKGIEEQAAARRDLAREKQTTRKEEKENQALQQTKGILESARGNAEVMQALRDRYAASKALPLVNKYNPDQLSPIQVHLLASEVAKIATGGVPAVSELKALTPDTIKSRFAKIVENLINKPNAANAGAFIKQYKDYLEELNENANRVLHDKINRVIESSKKQLGEENYNALKEQYIKPYETTGRSPTSETKAAEIAPNEVKRMTKDGRIAIFDAATKQFLRYE